MPPYDVIGAWYGVQISGGPSNGVVTTDMYIRNATQIIDYMLVSPLKYTTVMLQLDDPVAAVGGENPKPNNYSTDVQALANFIATIPTSLRVGVHIVLEADAAWEISPRTILSPKTMPGKPFNLTVNNTWYGGSGEIVAAPPGTAPEMQAAAAAVYNGFNVCPWKVGIPGEPDDWPTGCPANVSRAAWYVCLVNALLQQSGSAQRITAMVWDTEGNGPVGIDCTIAQFMLAVDKFSYWPGMKPALDRYGGKWLVQMNGGFTLDNSVVSYQPQKTACGYFQTVPLSPQAQAISPSYKTLNDIVNIRAAGEQYWYNGQDLGGAACMPMDRGNIAPTIASWGLAPCIQSAPGKPGYDYECGCRETVYSLYGAADDGGTGIMDVLHPLWDFIQTTLPTTTPTFSIEHLGSTTDPSQFDECINSQNFCGFMGGEKKTSNWQCMADASCTKRCGTMNAFGTFTELCFKQFLDNFVKKYKATSVMVYDMGFVPNAWMQALKGTPVPGSTKTYVPPNVSPGFSGAGCVPANVPSSCAAVNATGMWCNSGVGTKPSCPVPVAWPPAKAAQYNAEFLQLQPWWATSS